MNSKIFILDIIVAIFVVALTTPYEANAETGTLTIDAGAGNSYTVPASFTGGTYSFDKIEFFSSGYNKIASINYTYSQLTFSNQTNTTQFHFISGATGSGGTVTYNSVSKSITWYFADDTIVTSSEIVLSYNSNIFTGVGCGFCQYEDSQSLSSSQPAYVRSDAVSKPDRRATGSYIVQSSTLFSNSYNVTYTSVSQGILANVAISKSGATVASKINILNSTDSKFQETSFNTADFSYSFIYDTGIALNMTDSQGDSDFVVVNSTAYTGPGVPTPTNTPIPTGSPITSSDSIFTTKLVYNNTESVDIFGSFYPATTTQTDCLFFGFICTDTTINIESNTAYVFISTQGSTSPIQFLSFTPDKNNNYDILTSLDIGTYQAQLFGFAAPGSTCPSGIVYDFPQIPLGCYYPHNITTFQVVNNTPGLFIHWQTKLANSSAIYGDTITVAWNNVTANDIVKIYDNTGTAVQTYPINISTVSQIPVFIPLYTVGTWNATIFNGSNLSQSASAFLNVLPPGAISVNNSFGISMYWSKAVDFIDNPTTLNWNTGSYSGLYFITVTLNGQEVRNNSYTAVPGQIQQAVYSFDTEGTYVAQFLDINGTVQAQSDIQISHVVAQPTSTEPIPSGSEASQSLGNNLITFMAMPAFWGLILWIIVVYAISSSSASGSTALVAFIMANMEAVIGLWSPFTWYILAITWIFAGIYFYFGQEMSQPR